MKFDLSRKATFVLGVVWSLVVLYCMAKFESLEDQDVPPLRIPKSLVYFGPVLAFAVGPAVAAIFCNRVSSVLLAVAGTMTGLLVPLAALLICGAAKPHQISGSLVSFAVYTSLIALSALTFSLLSWHVIGRRIAFRPN